MAMLDLFGEKLETETPASKQTKPAAAPVKPQNEYNGPIRHYSVVRSNKNETWIMHYED